MKSKNEMQKELVELYSKWLDALIEEGYFYSRGENSQIIRKIDFSNPYLCGIPDDWNDKPIRLMICGREGNGEISKNECGYPIPIPTKNDGYGDFIDELQTNNLEYVNATRERGNFQNNNYAFATTFKMFQNN